MAKTRKNVVYSEGTTEIYTTYKSAKLKTLLELLKDTALTRKQIYQKTGWTKGQLAGLLHRNRILFDIENRHISLREV